MILFPTGINLTAEQEICLLNDLTNVEDWVNAAIAGKINNCKKRLLNEWTPRLFADAAVLTIPADEDAIIAVIVARPDYKNRTARDLAGR